MRKLILASVMMLMATAFSFGQIDMDSALKSD